MGYTEAIHRGYRIFFKYIFIGFFDTVFFIVGQARTQTLAATGTCCMPGSRH